MSHIYSVRVRGPLACFTRPEFKTERFSYEIITPSAARGVLEAILWKPAIQWRVHKISLLAPMRFIQIKRNEITKKTSVSNVHTAAKRGAPLDYFADEDRAQRNTLALRDVDYAIEASFTMTAKAGAEDNPRKFDEMFRRRLERGQFFSQPYLGCREFPAIVEPYSGQPGPVETESRDLGYMLHDLLYASPRSEPVFFRASIRNGIVEVPQFEAAA
jgi:CRISPR-associated protein Cas5d